jgi:3-deoxy-D-manno-octulosonic-acid transferase
MQNFAALAERFIENEAAVVVKDGDALAGVWAEGTEMEWKQTGERALIILESLRGASEKTVKEIEILIDPNL